MKQITINKPANILLREISVDPKEISKALIKSGVSIISGRWDDLSETVTDLISSLGLKNSIEQISWILVFRGVNRALKKILDESPNKKIVDAEIEKIRKSIKKKLTEEIFTIDNDFFINPGRSDISLSLSKLIKEWLIENNFNNHEATSIILRLENYINLSFHEEWDSSPKEYSPILENGKTPFSNIVEIDLSWIKYKAWLNQQISNPMFFDEICLRQLYVPLRGWYKLNPIPEENSNRRANVIDIYNEISLWIDGNYKDDPIRLISGGPGSGKSSFAKIFAAEHSKESKTPIIFIPLHHFELSGDIFDSVERFLKLQGILKDNPIERKIKTVIIFDGLDELSLQGKVGERARARSRTFSTHFSITD
jgi:predicted NACHT family NTPase